MNTQSIILDISKPDAIMPMVTIGQGDASGTTIVASIYDNGTEVSLGGKSAMLEVRLPDGKSYVRDANCTVSGNKITYVVDEEHVGAVAGVTDDAYFDILDGPTVIYSTNRFRLRILRSARTDAKPAESWDTEVDAMIARGDAAIAAGVADGQSRITAAISDFDTRQSQNDTAQAENNLEQAKNNADQAENNRSAQGLVSQVLTSEQYDPVNRRPTITGELGKIYLVPKEDASTSDGYYEWMWIGSKWEQIGITQTTIVGITTDEIDAVIEGEGGTGNQTLNLTGLNYLWLKEVDYFDDNYSGIATKTTQGTAYGPLASVTANGHAEQDGTPTPSDPKEIAVVRGHEVTGKTGRYVDLVVTADGTTTTTPIPLPSRGWVGSLPDGTHDALAIDGAGKVTWELADAEVVFDGSSDETWAKPSEYSYFTGPEATGINVGIPATTAYMSTIGVRNYKDLDAGNAGLTYAYGVRIGIDGISDVSALRAWLTANPVELIYKLATATTESMGYVDLPDIPEGAVVSMPELEGLGVESWTSDAVADYTSAVVGKVDTNGAAITPASVTATGAVSGSSVSDSVGSLADLRDSVSRCIKTAPWTSSYTYTPSVGALELVIVTVGDNIGLYFVESYADASYIKELSDQNNAFSSSVSDRAVKITASSGSIGTHLRFRLND